MLKKSVKFLDIYIKDKEWAFFVNGLTKILKYKEEGGESLC